MQKILIMTDIHICDVDENIIDLDPVKRFDLAKDQAFAEHPDALALVLMGDLTHHGRITQYERLKEFLDPIEIPYIPMLGNHDRRDAFLSVFNDAPQTGSGHIQAIIDLEHHRLITLDTLDGPPYPQGHHAGLLCQDRLDWLKDALEGAGKRIPLIFAHHPPFDTGILGMDLIKLTNGDAMLNLIAQYQHAHLFCGHIHRTISGSTKGVPWTMFKSPCHQGALDLTNPDSSLSLNEPGAYGLLLLTEDGVVAHSQDVGSLAKPVSDAHSQSAGK